MKCSIGRRVALIATFAGLSAACGSDGMGPDNKPPVDTTTPAPPLRQLAQAHNIRIGTAVGRLFRNDAEGTQFRTIVAREFNAIVAENDMKHAYIEPARGVFRFERPDSMLAFAEANGMQMRGHVLVWHNQNAGWLTSGTWTPADVTQLMTDHITTVVTHYKARIVAWDVVNEALSDDGTRRSSIWADNVGPAYVELAFRTARAADPQALLFYNDYNIEGSGRKSDSTYVMIKDLVQRGVPIDGVGFQGHFQAGGLPSRQAMIDNIARYAALGLKVHFTEVDVRVPMPSSPAQVATQADDYRRVFDVCIQSPACQMVMIWGVTDKDSWVPSTFPGWGDALLFDASYNKKTAYWSVHNLLSGK